MAKAACKFLTKMNEKSVEPLMIMAMISVVFVYMGYWNTFAPTRDPIVRPKYTNVPSRPKP